MRLAQVLPSAARDVRRTTLAGNQPIVEQVS